MNKIQSKLGLVSVADSAKIARIDAPKLSTKVDEYVKTNLLAYYVLLNTWLLAVQEYSKFGWMRLFDRLMKVGLIPVIKDCQDAATAVIADGEVADPMIREILRNIQHTLGVPIGTTAINQAYRATALFLLRYPKRFSPLNADLVEKDSIASFIQRENRTKLLTRRGYSACVVSEVRAQMASLLPWDVINKAIDSQLSDYTNLVFTPGVCRDARSSLGSKLMAISEALPEFFIEPFGIPYSGCYPTVDFPEKWGQYNEDVRVVTLAAVPKDYKSARIIAPETVVRQGRAGVIADILTQHLPDNIPLRDQSVNGRLAYEGSVDGSLATIDLSAASDSISKQLFWEVFPESFAKRVYPYLGTHYEYDGKRRLMHMMSTSGNALTFVLESILFCAICKAAEAFARRWGADLPEGRTNIPSVYGDDQVVWSGCYETTRDFLEALGFIVNEAKSYWEGPYRESCGQEWYGGVDCSTVYFPRFPIVGTISAEKTVVSDVWRRDSRENILVDSLTSLVSLQHRLYGVCYAASRFIREVISDAVPKMTQSPFGAECQDCWEYEDTGKPAFAPKAHFEDVAKGRQIERKLVNERSDIPRVKRFTPGVEFEVKGSVPAKLIRLYDIYKYQEFLKHGPRYDSEFDRLLHISARPRSLEEIIGSPKIVWRYRISAD